LTGREGGERSWTRGARDGLLGESAARSPSTTDVRKLSAVRRAQIRARSSRSPCCLPAQRRLVDHLDATAGELDQTLILDPSQHTVDARAGRAGRRRQIGLVPDELDC
jgi:hypothetical protein